MTTADMTKREPKIEDQLGVFESSFSEACQQLSNIVRECQHHVCFGNTTDTTLKKTCTAYTICTRSRKIK